MGSGLVGGEGAEKCGNYRKVSESGVREWQCACSLRR